jgi:multisubunit Na+/H+ antiporter MnhB subunit
VITDKVKPEKLCGARLIMLYIAGVATAILILTILQPGGPL